MNRIHLISALALSMLLGACKSSRHILDGPGMEREVSPQELRADHKLSTSFVKNAEGKVTHINLLSSYMGEKKVVAKVELEEPVAESFFEGYQTMMEQDLNFDGLPDVQVFKGRVINSLYWEGFVWNPKKTKFELIDGFNRIPNASPSTHGDCILGMCEDDPTEMVLSRYEWKEGHLIKVDEERHRLIIDPGPVRVPTEGEPVWR